MFILSAEGRLLYFNDAAEQIIGKPFAELGEIAASEFGDMLQLHEPDGTPLRKRDSPAGRALFERRASHHILRATGYDGVQRDVEVTAYPLFGNAGEMHGVVTVFWPAETG